MGTPAVDSPTPLNANRAIESVLAHVGTVRSEILVFSILACILLNGFAAIFNYQHPGDLMSEAMKLAGIAVVFLGFAFYFYAYLRLPSSSQELVFTEQALPEIAKTKKVMKAARGGAQ
jgi:drug/metabolite transporter (DMT)-like permease